MKHANNAMEAICKKYGGLQYNDDNYTLGGGLDGGKFASRRHEDAKSDRGKITLGEATQLFKRATGLSVNEIRDVLAYAVSHMEWHHAGKLPKSYGGGMKKTYFLNASEVCDCARNWGANLEALRLSRATTRTVEDRRMKFLQDNATWVERVTAIPSLFYKTAQEMNGKYGWFDSTSKSYNMTEYFSGWEFNEEGKFREFWMIQ